MARRSDVEHDGDAAALMMAEASMPFDCARTARGGFESPVDARGRAARNEERDSP